MAKNSIKITENDIKRLVMESIQTYSISREYEELYDKIQDTVNEVITFVGGLKFENKVNNDVTMKLLEQLDECATSLSNIAHELEEHLAWD